MLRIGKFLIQAMLATIGVYAIFMVFVANWQISQTKSALYGECVAASPDHTDLYCTCVSEAAVDGMFFEGWWTTATIRNQYDDRDYNKKVIQQFTASLDRCPMR